MMIESHVRGWEIVSLVYVSVLMLLFSVCEQETGVSSGTAVCR